MLYYNHPQSSLFIISYSNDDCKRFCKVHKKYLKEGENMRENQNNADLRQAAKAAGVYFWQIANLWGVSESYMTRLFRHELTELERTRFLQAIDEISKREQA